MYIIQDFIEETLTDFDQYGLYIREINRQPGEGNCLLHTSRFFNLVYHLNIKHPSTPMDMEIINGYAEKYNNAIGIVRERPGVYRRHPNKMGDDNSFDDHLGLLDYENPHSNHKKEILDNGIENGWMWKYESKSGVKAEFGYDFSRIPGFVAHAFMANGKKPGLVDIVIWVGAVIGNSFSKGASGKLKTWHMINVFEDYKRYFPGVVTLIQQIAVLWWKKKTNIPQAFGDFYGYDHPFYRASKEIYG